MDPRIRDHAEVIVDHAIDAQAGDDVVLKLPAETDDLAVALHERLGERGANPLLLTYSERAERAFLRAREADADCDANANARADADAEGDDATEEPTPTFETPDHDRAMYEAADATVIARSGGNVSEKSDVTPETNAAYRRAYKPVQRERLATQWCLTQAPTAAHAQLAGMSTEAYEEFVYDAINRDWDDQREFQAQMVDLMDGADEVRVRSGEETDLRLSIAGNRTLNDYGEHNLPGGEVFTAPVRDSVEGEVHFDLPLYRQGREVEGVRLRFEEGRVESYSAERNESVLDGVFATDEGARYLGELGIGMNRGIDRFTYNMLFDEKMGDTVHLAVGSAYDDTVGEGNERNESAEHVDMIVDMSEDSTIEIDGEVVQRDGTFAFEDGFE